MAQNNGNVVLEHADRFFIGGEWVKPSTDAKIEIVSPSTEEVFLSVAEARSDDMGRAVAAARRAFDQGPWPRMSPAERAGYMREIGKGLNARAEQIGTLWTHEVGILQSLAGAYSQFGGAVYDYYAGMAETFPFEERHHPALGGEAALLVREPVGVVAAIVPWNVPVLLAAWKVAPALLAGCTIILKMSPQAPTSAYALAEAAREAGLPEGVLNVVTAEREVSEELVRNHDVDKVSFTGSLQAGKQIGAICGERIARCTLELGGKSAAVILDDYDVSKAAEIIAGTAPNVTGQVCASLTRIVVPQNRQSELVDAMKSQFETIKVGDPFDSATGMGPLAMARQRDLVEGYIAQGVDGGAKLVTGGGRPSHLNRGYYIEPTLFSDVSNDMRIAREEIFGPVLSIIPAKDEAEAIAIANDSNFGLNATVFTDDADRAYQVGRQLRSGTVGHNEMRVEMFIAFGGFKQSGIGREGGTIGLEAFTEVKTMIFDGVPSHLEA